MIPVKSGRNSLAYETDDTTLPDSDAEEYGFCANKVLPSSADFTKYGWSAIVSRCESLNATYNTTERKMFFMHKDQVGSTIALTDASGSTIQEYAYGVYGTPYVKSGTGFVVIKDVAGNLHGNDRLFTGREYNAETGLYYYRARFYDPENGRFISRDPIGTQDSINLYQYAKNDPIRYSDPTGLSSKPAIQKSKPTAIEALGLILKALISINPVPDDKMREMREKADSVAIYATTPFYKEGETNLKIHTEIVFFKDGKPIATLGSAPLFGWQFIEDSKVIEDTVKNGTEIGGRQGGVTGCTFALQNGMANSSRTFYGKGTICWQGAEECYLGAITEDIVTKVSNAVSK